MFCYSGGIGWDARGCAGAARAAGARYDDLEQLVAAVVSAARPGDHVLIMSNGGFGGVHQQLLARLAAN